MKAPQTRSIYSRNTSQILICARSAGLQPALRHHRKLGLTYLQVIRYKRSSEGVEERATWETMKSAAGKRTSVPTTIHSHVAFYYFWHVQVLDFTLNPA